MTHPLAGIQRSMSVDAEMLRLISDNIANAQTPGYQRKVGVQRAEFLLPSQAIDNQIADATEESARAIMAPLSIAVDSTPGTLTQSREPLDVALNGAGSLFALTPTGEVSIRGGKMRIEPQGLLVTQSGDPVLGVSGPINFNGAVVNYHDIEITADGIVKLSGNNIGQLRIESSSSQQNSSPSVAPRVMQGFVETSNVDSVTEMLKLMEVFRHFESSQKVLRNYDSLLQQAISDLGKA
jgi:flagellar basal-body rod protein FlgF